MATLTGKITDVTSKTPENISSITVKAPSVRIGSGTDVIVSSPATVDFNRDTGDITVSGLTGGLSWLYIEGDGWTDSIALAVAEGMITLVEAIANAAGAPGMADYISLLSRLEGRVDDIAQDAVDAAAEDIKWDRGVVGSGVTSIDQLDFGSWGVASTTVANNLGLPGTLGNLTVSRIATGKSVLYRTLESGTQKHEMWMTSITGGVVAPWKRVDSDGVDAGAPGLKTVGVTLTAGSALDGTAGRCRVLAQVTAPVTRWRVHIESRRQVFSSTADFTLGAVSVGRHTSNGAMTGAQTLKSGSTNIAGSSEWVSRWITNDLSEETLIDFNVSGTGLYSYQAGAYRLNGSTWEPAKEVPAAVWIEVETYAETPVVAMIGDSTGAGQGADRPVHESALHVAARKHRFIPMNYSYPGSTMQSMTNPEHHIYKRWAHLAKPDSVIIQSGSNDIHAGTSVADLRTRFTALAELARTISQVVIGSTVKARYPDSGEHQTNLNSHNTWVKTQPAGIRDFLDFYAKLSPNGTVAAADAADAAHLTTGGHGKLALAFDDVTVAREELSEVLAAKANTSYVDNRLSGVEPVKALPLEETAWAHATEDGLRLPLGYTPDGRLDAHARTIWREDAARLYATGQDSPYEHVVSTDTGHIIIGVLPDGTTVIPGLSTTSTSTPVWVSGQGVVVPTTDMRRASGWGSSTMYEARGAFSEMFAGLGVTYVNGAMGSELGDQTAARHGARPALVTFPGNIIPSSGDVDITVSNVATSRYLDTYEATVGGVLGMVSSTSTTWRFTRTEAGDPVTVAVDTPAIPTLGVEMSDAVQLLNLGKNTFRETRPNAPELINGYTDNAVEWLKPQFKNVLVIGHFNNTGRTLDDPVTAQVKEVNDYQRAKYGALFVDLHTFVTTDLFWDYTGLTPTADDLAEQALGNKPHSGSRDHAHFDETGQEAFAAFVRDHMLALGWY